MPWVTWCVRGERAPEALRRRGSLAQMRDGAGHFRRVSRMRQACNPLFRLRTTM